MTLVVKRFDGKVIEYPNADRSKAVIEWVENCERKTAIYDANDFLYIAAKDCEEAEIAKRLDAVIDILTRTLEVSKGYEDKNMRECYERDIKAIRAMLQPEKTEELEASDA